MVIYYSYGAKIIKKRNKKMNNNNNNNNTNNENLALEDLLFLLSISFIISTLSFGVAYLITFVGYAAIKWVAGWLAISGVFSTGMGTAFLMLAAYSLQQSWVRDEEDK